MSPRRQINSTTGICFFRADAEPDLVTLLRAADYEPLALVSNTLDLETRITDWFNYGCIYLNGHRQRENRRLVPGELVRLHTRLKRYPHPPTLSPYIVYEENDFLVLDKPAGLPTHPTLDNFIENAKVLLERERQQTLYSTHRLDIPTHGLLILAKSADGQRRINKLFSQRQVQKTYRSLNEALLPTGEYVHYMSPEGRAPRTVSTDAHAGWWECRLRVDSALATKTQFAHELSLLTGRTHQIRAQMAALKAPVLGDGDYGSQTPFALEGIALECCRLSFIYNSRTLTVTRPRSLAPELGS